MGLPTKKGDFYMDITKFRTEFEVYKSNICHLVKDLVDIDFIIGTLESNKIRTLYDKKWYPESLYLLAMLDYLSRENDLPICNEYSDLRRTRLSETIFPASMRQAKKGQSKCRNSGVYTI